HALFHAVADAIAHDDDHVAILDDVGFVAETPAAGNDARAAVLKPLRHGEIEHVIEGANEPLHVAAALDVDDRIPPRREQVADGDRVGLPKQHYAVAVRMRVRLVHDEHGLAVEPDG